jgi:hypothetical protein
MCRFQQHRKSISFSAGDQQSLRLADFSSIETGFEGRKSGIEAALKTDAAQNTRPGHSFSAEACPFQREIHRFFTKDRLTCSGGPLDEIGVGVGARGNDYGMDFGIAERRLDGGRFCAVCHGEFGRRGRVNIHHLTQRDSRQARYIMGVDFSDSACAEDCCIDHIIIFQGWSVCCFSRAGTM